MGDLRWSTGMFVRELTTDGVDAARRFYGELFGWKWKDAAKILRR
jgi:predicted enzyme related to lactoylglutathione lyase